MRKRRKSKLVFLLFLVALFVSGCSITESPEELMQPPKLEGDKEEIRMAIKEYLPKNTKLITPPMDDDKLSSIKFVDLDGDGVDEALVFYSIYLEESPYRILILKKQNQKWVNKDEIKITGQELDRVLFKNISGNNGLEIVIGSKEKYSLNKDITVYALNKREKQVVFKNMYDEVIIDDLDNDEVSELLLLKKGTETQPTTAELYKSTRDGILKVDEVSFSANTEINYAVYDYLYKNEKGIIISTTEDKEFINTYLMKVVEGKLVDLLDVGFIKSRKEDTLSVVKPIDINQDETLEFAVPNKIQRNSPEKLINKVTEWYSYDGDRGVKLVAINYYDEVLNFSFDLPLKWRDKLIVTNQTSHKNTIREEDFVSVDFKEDDDSKRINLLNIYVYNKDRLKRIENNIIKKEYTKVLEDKDRIYYLDKQNNRDELKKRNLDTEVEKIEKSFRLLEN